MNPETISYNDSQTASYREICDLLGHIITDALPEAENKIWHAHPVWFLEGNPVAGYSCEKAGVRLMFWSGADFGEPGLDVPGKKFRDASKFYTAATDANPEDIRRWLCKAREIQWDYKNIVKRKGILERLK